MYVIVAFSEHISNRNLSHRVTESGCVDFLDLICHFPWMLPGISELFFVKWPSLSFQLHLNVTIYLRPSIRTSPVAGQSERYFGIHYNFQKGLNLNLSDAPCCSCTLFRGFDNSAHLICVTDNKMSNTFVLKGIFQIGTRFQSYSKYYLVDSLQNLFLIFIT